MVWLGMFAGALAAVSATAPQGRAGKVWIDPVTRYIHVTYRVPAGAPDEVVVRCSWAPAGTEEWRPARVTPLLSETGLRFTREAQWREWMEQGRIVERRAAGLERTVVFHPYPEAEVAGKVAIRFRVQVQGADGKSLSEEQAPVQADNTDVVVLNDWSKVLQKDLVSPEARAPAGRWSCPAAGRLTGSSAPDLPLRPLTYPLGLRGTYALFVGTPAHVGMRLRLTGDEGGDTVGSPRPGEEVFWRWCRMDRQHLVLQQPHGHKGYSTAQIEYVRLVPLSPEVLRELEGPLAAQPDKVVAGYFEPYSWAFAEDVRHTVQHREPLAAFAEAGVQILDIQVGRFGMKSVYETRRTDQLLYSTIGDPIGTPETPVTDNVGQMQQYTNALDAELRYAGDLGLAAHANFGATNCYPETLLQGDVTKEHPDWRRGHALRYELPEVRRYILDLYHETLEIGAPALSLDFCRYPEGIDKAETCTAFLRELKALREEFSRARKKPVPLLVRFPARGVRLWPNFDYRTWAREGLVEFLCPSNIQARHMHFDIAPYVEAVRGSKCKLLPVVDGLEWGLQMPGPFLWRVEQLYDAGVDGVYVYQADGRILGWPADRRCMRLLGSSRAVRAWWEQEERLRPRRSKGIFVTPTHSGIGDGKYHGWDRLRVWLEGIAMREVELYLDGNLVSQFAGPPYLLGTEENESDGVIPPGEHRLRVRARDGDGWLEQTFTVKGAG